MTLLAAIFKLFASALKLIPLIAAYVAGKNSVALRLSKKNARAKAWQAELAARPRLDARDLVQRMRDNDGL